VIRDPFDHYRPTTMQDAVALLDRLAGEATVLGGGTMLIPSMTLGQAKVHSLLELTALGLDTVTMANGFLCLGALASYADILRSEIVAEQAPLLRAMAEMVTGGPSILNQGTLGGSACFANPASDVPACLVVLDAELELASTAGMRRVAARDFFEGPFRTARRENEFLARILIPLRDGTKVARYAKYKSCASSWPIVTVACVLYQREPWTLALSVGAAAGVPTFHAFTGELQALRAPERWVDAVVRQAGAAVGSGWSDELADASYRRAIVPGAVRRMLRDVLQEVSV
jgi:carbon-monoxide dehydrogenase medium subunit